MTMQGSSGQKRAQGLLDADTEDSLSVRRDLTCLYNSKEEEDGEEEKREEEEGERLTCSYIEQFKYSVTLGRGVINLLLV